MASYKVLITTSGIGQRLGELTLHTNKSLVRVGKKPAISYIIEQYPDDVPLVITVGYFEDHVREFVAMAYPHRTVEFVVVDKYVGPGSSLGYSLRCAKDQLQTPFIYHACDTIVTQKIPAPTRNWIGGHKGDDSSQYASFMVNQDKVRSYCPKGAIDFDYLHIGLVGIHDYGQFWGILDGLISANPTNSELNDCAVIEAMLKTTDFRLIQFFQWFDIGNTGSLRHARAQIDDTFDNLDKTDESIFLFDDFVIKFFSDPKLVRSRCARAEILGDLVPKIEAESRHFYRYAYQVGEQYSNCMTPVDFEQFLQWADTRLWTPTHEVSSEEFKAICVGFYYTKTLERTAQFLKIQGIDDTADIINGERIPPLSEILSHIDFQWLSSADQTMFHGDFILENILKTEDGYCLVDWRQNFGGLLTSGDIYYDLAKLNHNLTINHHIVNSNLFTIDIQKKEIACDILQRHTFTLAQSVLFDFIRKKGLSEKKVRLLTSIIWLNMSPLHHYPFNLFLYYFGKYTLWNLVKPTVTHD